MAASFRENSEVEQFMDELVATYQFDRRQLRAWFAQAAVQSSVLKAISSPSTARPWFEYRAGQVTAARIRGGIEYWRRHAGALSQAAEAYGVPEEIIVATIGIESFYGRNVGTHPVFDALATLAFGYPPRSALFREELVQLLLLAREKGENPLRYKGSYAGALGVSQFLPSSYRRYAVDFNNDGSRDLWNHSDAIGSIANYYREFGWRSGERVIADIDVPAELLVEALNQFIELGLKPQVPVAAIRRAGMSVDEPVTDEVLASVIGVQAETGRRYLLGFGNFYVITRYNRSVNYALSVYELAQELLRARQTGEAK